MLTWKRQLSAVWTLGLLAVIFLLQVVRFLIVVHDGQRLDAGDVIFGVFDCSFAVVATTYLLVEMITTRVRLLTTGVEVRHGRTRLYPYADIVDARIDRASNDRIIKLVVRDGRRVVVLPAPTRGLRPPSDQTLPDAVAAIRERAGLEVIPPILP